MSAIQTLRATKKVGLIIHPNAHLFSNGIIQNAYFIHQCLESIGLSCQFLCHEENPANFGYKDLSLKQICMNELIFDPREYHTLITISSGLSKELYALLKSHNVFVVGFICGNTLMHDMEDFCRGSFFPGSSTHISKATPTDELWVIPSYAHSLEYISIIRGKPAYTVPHLWSHHIMADIVANDLKKSETELFYDFATHTGPQIDVLILEPNLAVFKNAWIPIVACEKLEIENKNLIDNVYAFNFPQKDHAYNMTDNLIVNSKLRKFKRLTITEIFLHFNTKKSMPVIVSHQTLNGLNYLYYEALYYGWPLVHNSKEMEDCGYYYSGNDISSCAAAIKTAIKHHNRNIETYKEKAHAYLQRVDPLNPAVGKLWDQYINVGLSKCV